MAWPNPFYRRTANTKTCWGYTFELTKDHMNLEQSKPLKFSYDVLAEECLEILDTISPPPPRSQLPRQSASQHDSKTASLHTASGDSKPGAAPTPPRDLYALLRDNHGRDPKLTRMWEELHTIPDWVDWDQIARGQDVFYRYASACFTGLAYQSLLGGMGAARVVETLARTGGFSTKVARRRLFETTQHILQCTRSLESIQPDGEGFASSIRVRFLHAAVRNRIMKLARERPDYYNVEKWGVPINDLDSIATVGTFSATLIWLSLPRQGIFIREQEKKDYIALWRYIGYLLGTPTDFFETPERAKAMMESLLMNEIDPSETSKLLANNIIRSLDDQPPAYASAEMLTAGARWLNGSELSDRLDLMPVSWYYYMLFAGQCFFFMSLAYVNRTFAASDKKRLAMLRRVFWQIIVESKYGLQGERTYFELQYIPELGTVTEQARENEHDRKQKQRGSEWRNFKAFICGVGLLAGATWTTYKLARGIIGLGGAAISMIQNKAA